MKNCLIRPATLSDLDQLIDLENQCFVTDKMSQRNYRELLKKQSANIEVAIQDNDIIASAILLFRKNSRQARIYSIAVMEAFRGQGIAKQLCDILEKNARLRDCNEIILEVRPDNQAAIQFYQKNLYTVFGEYPQFYEDGANALRMRKELM